jgi:hypothetical protein
MNFKFLTLLFFSMLSIVVDAQRSKQLTPLYTNGTAYRNTGWFVSPGITYMLPEYGKREITEYVPNSESRDTLYSGQYKRTGRIGIYADAGRHHFMLDNMLVHHIDYGIHFKMLRGTEKFEGLSKQSGALTPALSSAKFSESFVGAFFNASNIIQVKNKWWIQNSLGVNADFRVISRRTIDNATYGATMNYPDFFLAQLHYKLGVGWKPEAGIYIVPSIETPILNAFPWDSGKSTLQYFAGRYRPLIFSVRIQWLSKAKARKCEGMPKDQANWIKTIRAVIKKVACGDLIRKRLRRRVKSEANSTDIKNLHEALHVYRTSLYQDCPDRTVAK